MLTFLLPLSFFLMPCGVALDDPPLIAELHSLARKLPSDESLSGPAGLELLRAYDGSGRPQAYIAGWKEGSLLNAALAKSAALRGLSSTAKDLGKVAGKTLGVLPAALTPNPERGPNLEPESFRRILLAWPFEGGHLQGRRFLGAPLDMLKPAAGDVISGRTFRLVEADAGGKINLGILVNPWGDSAALAAFSVYTPAEVDLGLEVETSGTAQILTGQGSARGWRTILILLKPRTAGPLVSNESWSFSLSMAEGKAGFVSTNVAESLGDDLSGYLAWTAGGIPSVGAPLKADELDFSEDPRTVAEETQAGRIAWTRGWMSKGYTRPVQARGRKGEGLGDAVDGRMDTAVALKKGETWAILDLGQLASPVSVALFLDQPALLSAVVEGSKDGGHYALLGEFKDLKDKKTIELAPDQGGSYRMLRLILTSESDSAVLREVLVSYTRSQQ